MSLADEQIDTVTSTVNSRLSTVRGWAASAQSAAEEAINAVGTFDVPNIDLVSPPVPNLTEPVEPKLTSIPNPGVSNSPTAVGFSETGQVSFTAPPELPQPEYGTPVQPGALPVVDIPSPPIEYPQAPIPALPAEPTLAQPLVPTLDEPVKPALLGIAIPDFNFPTIPSFNGVVPEYRLPDVSINPQVQLATYDPAALKERIKALSMDTMPAQYEEICRVMTDELVNSVDLETAKVVEAAFTKWAALNFSIAPGMLIDEVNEIRAASGRKIRDGKQKLNQEFFKVTFENFKAAVSQGMALEKHLIDLHLEHARQSVEVEKIRVKAAVALFDAAVSMHNAQQNARGAHAAAYKAELSAKLNLLSANKIAVDAAVAEIAENDAKMQMFGADVKLQQSRADVFKTEVQALTADIELYKSTLGGIKAQSEVAAANIGAYREAVKAYASGVDATSAELTAYVSQVQAAGSSANVYESNARAYASYVQEASRRAGAYTAYTSAQTDVLRANLQTYSNAAAANEGFVRAQAARFSAQAEIASAQASAYSTSLRAYTSYNKATAQYNAAVQQYSLAAAENAARAQALSATAQAETDKINAGALAAKAQALAGLAQGAMSAMYVSASAQGSGNTNSGATFSYGVNSTWGGATTKSESARQVLSA